MMMKAIVKLRTLIFCVLLAAGAPAPVVAQDASHYETATSTDRGDWGLLGLLGLIGLLGLRKKKSPEGPVRTTDRT